MKYKHFKQALLFKVGSLIENPKATSGEMVDAISNLSLGGVKFVIGKLQKKGLLKRVGGRKHGEWQVLI